MAFYLKFLNRNVQLKHVCHIFAKRPISKTTHATHWRTIIRIKKKIYYD